jgi:hypothetical protein
VTETITRGTGWIINPPSPHDWQYAARAETLTSLPATVDLDPLFPEVYDQKQTNSCVGQAVVACFEYARQRQGLGHMDASTLFAYWNARVRGGNTASDNGAHIRDGILGLRDEGICESRLWPFVPDKVTTRPGTMAVVAAKEDVLVQFRSVQHTEQQLMAALAEGYAIVIGSLVYQDFMQPQNGIVKLPSLWDQEIGAHAYALSGYDATQARYPGALFKIHNSYGQSWAQSGRGWIPGAYLTDSRRAADATAIEVVRDDTPLPVPPVPPPGPDPWTEYGVGPGIAAKMRALGDVPVSPEREMVDQFMRGTGVRDATGASGATYRWIVSQERCVVFKPAVT